MIQPLKESLGTYSIRRTGLTQTNDSRCRAEGGFPFPVRSRRLVKTNAESLSQK